jgi:hypothetical protein
MKGMVLGNAAEGNVCKHEDNKNNLKTLLITQKIGRL